MSDRVAIVGARSHPDLGEVRAYVRELPPGDVVISGGAEGVDRAAEETAVLEGLTVVSYRVLAGSPRPVVQEYYNDPNQCCGWTVVRRWLLPVGLSIRDALIFRNTFIAVGCTRMVAFSRGTKGGTVDAIRQAKRFRRPVDERGEPPKGG
jgi:hypothetical protein